MKHSHLLLVAIAIAIAIAMANAALGLIASGIAVPANIVIPFLVCIVAGWIMTFQVGGVRASLDWKDWVIFGPLAPNRREWVKPLPPSKATQVFVLAAGAALGGVAGLMFVTARASA